MCPACIATAAWIAAGAGSTGGLTAYVFGRRRSRKDGDKTQDPRSRAGLEGATHSPRDSQSGSGS